MKSWVLTAPRTMALQQSQPTVLEEDYVKIKIEEVLFGNSDYGVYSGESTRKYPFVPCRNAVGVISETFDKKNSLLQKMDRVVIEPYLPCSECDMCHDKQSSKCANMVEYGYNVDGVLRNFMDVPLSLVHLLPDNLSDEKALFVPHVSLCLNVADDLKLTKGKHVAIFTSTKTGLILAQIVAYYQAVPILISDEESVLDTARELGVFYCFNPSKCDVEKETLLVTGGRMCDEVAYFANSEFKMKDVYSVAAVNASICLVGYANKASTLSVAQICQKHLNIFCVSNGAGNYSSAINLLVTNTVKVEKLLGKTVNFDDLNDTLATINEDDLVLHSLIVKVN